MFRDMIHKKTNKPVVMQTFFVGFQPKNDILRMYARIDLLH